LFLTLVVVSLLKDLVRQGKLPEPLNLTFHGLLLLIGGMGLATRSESAHHALAFTALAAFVAYVGLLFAELV
jgi:hypothetical protein